MTYHRFRALFAVLPLLVVALLVAALAVPAAPGAASAERPIMAFYYPWYDMSDWSYDRMSDLPVPQYSGGDDETLERHIQQADAAGIDALICAWFGPNEPRLDARCRRLMELAAESGSNLKIAIMPEQAAWEDLNNVDNLVQALGVLERDFMSQSNYLTFQGKPVVFWFNPPSLGGAATWQQVRERADPQRQQFWFGGTDQSQYLDVYDTLYFFDITWETAPGNAMASYASLLEGTGRPFAATVMPGYDDIAIRGGHRRDRENGAYYRGTWEDAVSYNADAVVITSFNEFAEGSHIEPSEQYGDFYLQLTREMVDYFHANVGQTGHEEPPQPSPVGTPVVAPPEPGACRTFAETGFEVCGRLLQYWNENGGLPVFGYPISAQQELTIEGQAIQAQWFERNRLELHPENARPYDVLLGRLGVDVLEQQGRDWQAFPTAAEQAGCRYFAETGQNVCGDILAAWRANGLELGDPGISEAESLALFGLPISPLQEEEIDGQMYQVQWFERARFERHPENAPPFDVLLGLLGREAHTSSPAPQATAAPVANPTATPSGLPAPGSLGGWIAFTSEGNIFTINADGSNREQLTTDGVSSFGAWSPDARRILFTSGRDGNAEVYVMDADGSNQTRLTTNPRRDMGGSWSPDGSKILFLSERSDGFDIYVMNADGSEQTRLTASELAEASMTWSPDGTRIAFSARPAGEFAIYVMNADGSNLQRIAEGNFPRWSPDGTQLVFTTFVAGGGDEVLVINADGTGLTNLSNHPANDFDPRWSPDGMRIAFVSDRDPDIIINNQPPMAPQSEIYVMRADGSGQTRLTAAPTQKLNPTWSPDGTRLLYRVLTVVLEQPGTLFLMNADGSGQTELVEGGLGGWQPAP